MKVKFNTKEIDYKVIECLKKTFPKVKFKKNINNLKMGDIKQWDSLGNLNLIFEIEKKFKIKFNSREINNWKNIGEIILSIESKL